MRHDCAAAEAEEQVAVARASGNGETAYVLLLIQVLFLTRCCDPGIARLRALMVEPAQSWMKGDH